MPNWKIRISGPAAAIVAIVVCGILAERWLVPVAPTAPVPASIPQVEPPPAAAPVAAPRDVPSAAVWSTYHGGVDLAGYVDVSFPDKPALLWQYHAPGPANHAPVGDDHAIYLATQNGSVVSLDFAGAERWSKSFTRVGGNAAESLPERFEAPLACFRSTVFAGAKSGALRALDSATGEARWTYDVGGPILGSVTASLPASGEGPARVYVIQQDVGALHCLDFDTGKRLWRSKDTARCDGSPVVIGDTVVFGSCASAVHVFSADDGTLLRQIELGEESQVANGPAALGDDVYVGSRSGRFFRINTRLGRVIWLKQETSKEIFTTAALGGGLVVFGSEDGAVIAVDCESNRLKWRFEPRHTPTSAMFVGGKVAVGAEGVLHLLDAASGTEVWSYDVSDSISAPAVIHGMLVAGSEDGSVLAFGQK